MKRYDVEIIHEPSGAYLNYSFDSDDELEEVNVYDSFIRDISVIIVNEEEIDQQCGHRIHCLIQLK